jgi:hypothetical protein
MNPGDDFFLVLLGILLSLLLIFLMVAFASEDK